MTSAPAQRSPEMTCRILSMRVEDGSCSGSRRSNIVPILCDQTYSVRHSADVFGYLLHSYRLRTTIS